MDPHFHVYFQHLELPHLPLPSRNNALGGWTLQTKGNDSPKCSDYSRLLDQWQWCLNALQHSCILRPICTNFRHVTMSPIAVWLRPWAGLARMCMKIFSRWKILKFPGEFNTQTCSSNPILHIKSNNSSFLKRVQFSLYSSVWKFDMHKISIGMPNKRHDP